MTSGQLALGNGVLNDVTISGPAAGLTVSGDGLSRVLEIDSQTTAFISGLTITGGMTDRGGGVLNFGSLNLTNCSVTGNLASTNGGGIANYGVINLTTCAVSGNIASKNGGGLFTYQGYNGGSANVSSCTVSGNSTGGSGGGVYSKGQPLSLTGCTISNNTATQQGGGGLWVNSSSAGVATLTNCTVSGNSASTTGGSVYNLGDISITSCTVSANTTGNTTGGGLFNRNGRETLKNTIVAGNFDRSQSPSDIQGNVAGTYNLIGLGGSGGLPTAPGSGNIVLTSLAGLALAPLGYYGGPNPTMPLLPSSMAIGAGTITTGVAGDQPRAFRSIRQNRISARSRCSPRWWWIRIPMSRACRAASLICAVRSTLPMYCLERTRLVSPRPWQAIRSS